MKNIKQENKILIILFAVLFFSSSSMFLANDWERVINLNKKWKFAIGDKAEWSSQKFNDEKWELIDVPSNWEDHGYYGYDGFAWYRTEFKISKTFKGENLYLDLGYIDDVDQVFLNGELIGFSGYFPPNYFSAYNAKRVYTIPQDVLNFDKPNTIAIRVYDSQLEGGIVSGNLGVFKNSSDMNPEFDLTGNWKFKIGDNLEWKDAKNNIESWENVMVPGFWRYYGYPDYDGFAWYRKEFIFNKPINEKYVVILGKIDDIDEVYLNGKLVGATGNMEDLVIIGTEYSLLRHYFINPYELKENQKNVITIRVYDGMKDGGLYEGPVGIMKLKTFEKYWKEYSKQKNLKNNFWEFLFNTLFQQ